MKNIRWQPWLYVHFNHVSAFRMNGILYIMVKWQCLKFLRSIGKNNTEKVRMHITFKIHSLQFFMPHWSWCSIFCLYKCIVAKLHNTVITFRRMRTYFSFYFVKYLPYWKQFCVQWDIFKKVYEVPLEVCVKWGLCLTSMIQN